MRFLQWIVMVVCMLLLLGSGELGKEVVIELTISRSGA